MAALDVSGTSSPTIGTMDNDKKKTTSPSGLVSSRTSTHEGYTNTQEEEHKFRWSSLWGHSEVNPINGKSFTFPIFRFWDPYSTAFWLATLGFFVAFLSWFAFSPLVPEAVRDDLGLSQNQIIESNLASLSGTMLVRLIAGPACDKYGPRKVMAVLLILGAVPSGFAALVTNFSGLVAVRFFISILGGTFVPTQAWTTTFFDKSIVGTVNAFAGGWGNMGGGVTVAVMIGLFERYVHAGLSAHLAWRVCFPTVPVPCLLLVAGMVLLLGKDHPFGKWSMRHQYTGSGLPVLQGEKVGVEGDKVGDIENSRESGPITTHALVDTAQSEPLTKATLFKILTDARVWMCAVCYLLTFGLETALDAGLPGLINTLFASDNFNHVDAAYVASTYGLLNLFARPLGGVIADILYSRYGLKAKVWWLLGTAISQGIGMIGLGMYINYSQATIGGVIGFIILIAVTGFAANGAAYAVYGHIRPKNIGAVAGIIGAGGNVGGIVYTLIFRFQPGSRAASTLGTKFWISGIVNTVGVLPFFLVSMGDAV
ncbi:hypothetical protein S7711_01057 [Stachybotrys chartarum IBT 7711]|uniref:Nitrate/nitrite transporter n=1 Tax=Stachybotrys chartarum (strain CBS 109288 / IBT 7711) TaxID=1280523 RepID=A0A084B4A9_STACB|nr:hypothetical protein S7711_01057 [Stachybotrys chartarum IBT 7711]KFA54318.1 hypothetical protein S40293_04812 [Stachybotrys chartarum IBT 40293]